jgi:uncharacterized protein (DUF58 family)
MLTARGWWFILCNFFLLAAGLLGQSRLLILTGFTLMFWFCGEALLFAVRACLVVPRLRLVRLVQDERGPVTSLWAERSFEVRVTLHVPGFLSLPFVVVKDLVPFQAGEVVGDPTATGRVDLGRPLTVTYHVQFNAAGVARFEGLAVQMADWQGLFYHAAFVRQAVVLRVLPRLVDDRGRRATSKRYNLLPPPGIHRLRRPGSGSELLDLRDYLPGDPPKTIAWKVSARRDKLITKEFESEVPVRCTLFVDTSSSVRVPAARGTALARLIDIAAGVIQANSSARDLTGLCLFDEQGTSTARPDRSPARVTAMLGMLAEAAALAPTAGRVDPDTLVPLAHAFAQEVYPDLMRPSINAMPWYLTWVAAFPGAWRRRASALRYLFRRKEKLLIGGLFAVPILVAMVAMGFLFYTGISLRHLELLLPLAMLVMMWVFRWPLLVLVIGIEMLFILTTLISGRERRLARWRKRLAALLAVRYALGPGGLALLLEDEDQLSLYLQRFLAEHHVPYTLPLYDEAGRYQFTSPEKVDVLATALLRSIGKGHDNELFVLLADLLELDDRLEPLLKAVRVALGRHHQVMVICPWPPGLPLPGKTEGAGRLSPSAPLPLSVRAATVRRFHEGFARLKRVFGRLGVPVICAAGGDPVPLILERMERLRGLGWKR